MHYSFFPVTLAALALSGALPSANAGNATGAGSSFAAPIFAKWADAFHTQTGDQINYQSIGSGGGIKQVKVGTVDFGASDKPLKPEELAASNLAQFPTVIGGVVPVVNIPGIKPGQLRFSGALLADIFMGKVTQWDDPAIAAENKRVKLPHEQIKVVHRADGSGTTFNLTNYFSKVSPEWKKGPGEGTAISWPLGIGAKGNEGVSTYVNRLTYTIGYVEYAYVKQNNMTYGLVKNKAGNYIAPEAASFQAAAASADWKNTVDFFLVMTDAPGAAAYPITATVFVLMPKKPIRNAEQKTALRFFAWSLSKGQHDAEALDYVPLPPDLVEQVTLYWKKELSK